MEVGLRRVIDANLNRAAEAIRIVEDLCRFVWDASGFAGELKRLRHEVFSAVCSGDLSRSELVRHRDIEGDVGRKHASPLEKGLDARLLALRNLQRAREAIRTLEEACRLCNPSATPRLEGIRYALYGLEKGVARLDERSALRTRIASARVYLIVGGRLCRSSLLDVVAEAIAGGCDAVQLREKDLPDARLLELAHQLRELTARNDCLFFVNDRPDLAALTGADGVHCGQEDLPVAAARRVLPSGALVGVSTHNLEQALAAQAAGADYIGVGPVFPTRTKQRLAPLLGPKGLQTVLEHVDVPAFPIGGIDLPALPGLRQAGARRVALASAVLSADDVGAKVQAIQSALR